MNSNYKRNKQRAIFNNDEPTMTDQSQADDTNVNTIMRKYRITGVAPGAPKAPIYADFTEIPTSLQELMAEAQRLPGHIDALPPQLKGMPMEHLLSLTPTDLQTILRPKPAPTPAPTPARPPEEQKETK